MEKIALILMLIGVSKTFGQNSAPCLILKEKEVRIEIIISENQKFFLNGKINHFIIRAKNISIRELGVAGPMKSTEHNSTDPNEMFFEVNLENSTQKKAHFMIFFHDKQGNSISKKFTIPIKNKI